MLKTTSSSGNDLVQVHRETSDCSFPSLYFPFPWSYDSSSTMSKSCWPVPSSQPLPLPHGFPVLLKLQENLAYKISFPIHREFKYPLWWEFGIFIELHSNITLQLDPNNSNSDNSKSPLIWSNIRFPWSALLLIFTSLIQTPINSYHFPFPLELRIIRVLLYKSSFTFM